MYLADIFYIVIVAYISIAYAPVVLGLAVTEIISGGR